MADIEPMKQNSLWRRQEQLRRWAVSETNKEPLKLKGELKVHFQDGCVFLAACESGDKDEVERLLSRGADINTCNIDGLTALHQACIDDNEEMVLFLLKMGADIDAFDNEGWTALHATSSCGFFHIAEILIEYGANLSAANNDGDLAVDISKTDQIKELLEDKMDALGIDAELARNEEEEMMTQDSKQWLKSGIPGRHMTHTKTGASALHVAAAKGYLKVMKLLLDAGAFIDSQDFDGWTPLHAASHWNQSEACTLLVEKLCNMDLKTNAGQTVFDVADEDMEELLINLQKKQALLREEQKNLNQDILRNKNVIQAPFRRRPNSLFKETIKHLGEFFKGSSVTRMSVDQKLILSQKTAEEERLKMVSVSTTKEDDSNVSSEDDGGRGDIHKDPDKLKTEEKICDKLSTSSDSETQSESDSEIKKLNEINKQSLFPVCDQENTSHQNLSVDKDLSSSASVVTISNDLTLPSSPNDVTVEGSFVLPAISEKASVISEQNSLLNDITQTADKTIECKNFLSNDKHLTDNDNTDAETLEVNLNNTSNKELIQKDKDIDKVDLATITDSTSCNSSENKSDMLIRKHGLGDNSLKYGSLRTESSTVDTKLTNYKINTDPSDDNSKSLSSSWLPSEKDESISVKRRPHSVSGSFESPDSRHKFNDFYNRYTSIVNANKQNNSFSSVSSLPSVPYAASQVLASSANVTRNDAFSSQQQTDSFSDKRRSLNTLSPSVIATNRRSFEPPKRDEETETRRKARAKVARQTRRSTQGVTKEDLDRAEQTLREASSVGLHRTPSSTSTHLQRAPPVLSSSSTGPGAAKFLSESSQPPLLTNESEQNLSKSSRDNGISTDSCSSSSFLQSSDPSITTSTTNYVSTDSLRCSSSTSSYSTTDSSNTSPRTLYRSRYSQNKEDEESKSPFIRSRKKRENRRPTGKIILQNDQAISDTNKSDDNENSLTSLQHDLDTNDQNSDSKLTSSIPGIASGSSSSLSSSTTSRSVLGSTLNNVSQSSVVSDSNSGHTTEQNRPSVNSGYSHTYSSSSYSALLQKEPDYKRLYEDEKFQNEKLRKDNKRLLAECQESRLEVDKFRQKQDRNVNDKREKRALERRISELEEELKTIETFKNDNARLKEENGALIRVISKLSK